MFSFFLSAKITRFEHEYLKQQDWLVLGALGDGRWTEALSGLAQKLLIQHVGFVPICWGDYSLQQLNACPQMSLIAEPLAADNAGKLRRQQLRCRG